MSFLRIFGQKWTGYTDVGCVPGFYRCLLFHLVSPSASHNVFLADLLTDMDWVYRAWAFSILEPLVLFRFEQYSQPQNLPCRSIDK